MQKNTDLQILETQIVQRDWDKRWERIARVVDHENSYTFTGESGVTMTLIPDKWITTDVFDFILEEVK